MTAALIRNVKAAGGHLTANGDRLRVSAPTPLPDALVAELRQHKQEVLKHLARSQAPAWDAETEALIRWFLASEPPR